MNFFPISYMDNVIHYDQKFVITTLTCKVIQSKIKL